MRIRDGHAVTTWNRIQSPMAHSLQSDDHKCYHSERPKSCRFLLDLRSADSEAIAATRDFNRWHPGAGELHSRWRAGRFVAKEAVSRTSWRQRFHGVLVLTWRSRTPRTGLTCQVRGCGVWFGKGTFSDLARQCGLVLRVDVT